MKDEIYLLQGVFFFEDSSLGIGYDLLIGERATIQTFQAYATFQAVISPYVDGCEGFGGGMSDRFGESLLSDVKISEKKISFAKQYKNRPPIYYQFENKGGKGTWWEGTYKGKDTGEGLAHCLVQIVNNSFFMPESIKCPECGKKMKLEKGIFGCPSCGTVLNTLQ